MIQGKYIGKVNNLQNKTALLFDSSDDNMYFVQFDNIELTNAHGWHLFKKSDFQVDYNLSENNGD